MDSNVNATVMTVIEYLQLVMTAVLQIMLFVAISEKMSVYKSYDTKKGPTMFQYQ